MTYSWSPGGDFGSPTYSIPIPLVDGVRSTFIGERRRRWREALALALSRWGLPFDVTYRPEAEQPYVATEDSINTLGIEPLCLPDKLVLVRMHMDLAIDSAGWLDEIPGGVCLLTPWRAWWMRGGTAEIAGVAAHEIGHALGFGHGGNGVMVGKARPNDEERQLVADYYLGGT